MKTPDKILEEIALGSVTCFRGHEEEWDSFTNCCDIFKTERFGLPAMYWRMIKISNPDIVGIMEGAYAIDPKRLDGIILDPAFNASRTVMTNLSSFLTPRSMVRFASVKEAEYHMPKIDRKELRLDHDKAVEVRDLYNEYSKWTVTALSMTAGRVRMVVRDGNKEKKFLVPVSRFMTYLRKVSKLNVKDAISIEHDGTYATVVVRHGKKTKKIRIKNFMSCSVSHVEDYHLSASA